MTTSMKPRARVGWLMSVVCSLALLSTPAQAGIQEKYDSSCATCHQVGVLGAPRTGDKAAWAPRKAKGMAALLAFTKNGGKNMPARGLCDDCSDADYKALINYMMNGK